MNDTVTEIKNNFQGINSGVDEAKNHISNLDNKKAKPTIQNSKKKNDSKKMRII